MKLNQNLPCNFKCSDVQIVKHFPAVECEPRSIKMVMISESLPNDLNDYFYQPGNPMFLQTTNQAFADAGYVFHTVQDYLSAGIYLTTAIKCRKKGYLVSSETLKNCASVLAQELEQFENIKAIMLMGDFAIKCVNQIWKTKYGKKVIPAGSTYKIRAGKFKCNGIRFFPSYTQTGDSFNLEKSKRRMIAEDIKNAMKTIK